MARSTNKQALQADAQNRAWRTFLQGLVIDVGVALAFALTTLFGDASGWGDFQWAVISFGLAKTVVQSAASFVMRRFLDGSGIPTPLPPEPGGEPNVNI